LARHPRHEHYKQKSLKKIQSASTDSERKNLIATLNPPDSVIREVHAQLADQLDDIPEIVSAVVHGSHK